MRIGNIHKGYINYSKYTDNIGRRLYLAIIPRAYFYLLDIDFSINIAEKRGFIEIVFLGIGLSYDTPQKITTEKEEKGYFYTGGFRFRNDYRR